MIIAVIPARSGSKGIKDKNIRELKGKPLLYYQTKVALDTKRIDKVIVATDSMKYAEKVVDLFGDDVEIVIRPPEISDDKSKTEETLKYVLEKFSSDIIVTLQPTSPLNCVEYVDTCLDQVLNDGYDSCCCGFLQYGFFVGEPYQIERPMRQDQNPAIKEAGNCWVTKSEILEKENNRLGGKFGAVIIPIWSAFEIDDEADWVVVESLMGKESLWMKKNS